MPPSAKIRYNRANFMAITIGGFFALLIPLTESALADHWQSLLQASLASL